MGAPERPHPPPLFTGRFRHGTEYFLSRPHGTDDWLLIATVAGRGRFAPIGGEPIALERDVVALIRPRTGYQIAVDPEAGRWDWRWAHFAPRPAWREWLAWPEERPGVALLRPPAGEARRRFAAAFAQMHALRAGPLPMRAELAMNALEAALLWAQHLLPRSRYANLHPGVAAAMEFACRNLDRPLRVDDLARAARMSVSALAHLFPRQVGATPQRFVEGERLERARQLLAATDLPVKAIARRLGYDSPFYFSRRFARAFGASPSAWRDRLAGAGAARR